MKTNWLMTGGPMASFKWITRGSVDPTLGIDLERVFGEPNFKQIWWLTKAVKVADTICRIKFPNGSATGFLIDEDILITNNHVFENKKDTKNCVLQFKYRLTQNGEEDKIDEWTCEPKKLFKTNAALDYSICKIKNKGGKKPGKEFGFNRISKALNVFPNQRVNIIQHPQGRYQEIAFRDNQIKGITDEFIQYLTDTDYGSSGSPVFNDFFDVLGLHSRRVRDPHNPYRYYRNQGFRIDAIYDEINSHLSY